MWFCISDFYGWWLLYPMWSRSGTLHLQQTLSKAQVWDRCATYRIHTLKVTAVFVMLFDAWKYQVINLVKIAANSFDGAIHGHVIDSVPVAASLTVRTRIRFWSRGLPSWCISSSGNYCGNHTTTDSFWGYSHALLWTNSPSSTHSSVYSLASASGSFWSWFWNHCKCLFHYHGCYFRSVFELMATH